MIESMLYVGRSSFPPILTLVTGRAYTTPTYALPCLETLKAEYD